MLPLSEVGKQRHDDSRWSVTSSAAFLPAAAPRSITRAPGALDAPEAAIPAQGWKPAAVRQRKLGGNDSGPVRDRVLAEVSHMVRVCSFMVAIAISSTAFAQPIDEVAARLGFATICRFPRYFS